MEINSRFVYFYTNSFEFISKSFALIRERYAFIRDSYALIRDSFTLINEKFKSFPLPKISPMAFRTLNNKITESTRRKKPCVDVFLVIFSYQMVNQSLLFNFVTEITLL